MIVDIFANQPKWIEKANRWLKPTNWLIGHIQSQSNYNDLKYNRGFVRGADHKAYTEWLEKYLVPIVQKAVVFEKEKNSRIDIYVVRKKIKNSIDADVNGYEGLWVNMTDPHDSRMVTLTIPCHDNDKYAIQISFDWN